VLTTSPNVRLAALAIGAIFALIAALAPRVLGASRGNRAATWARVATAIAAAAILGLGLTPYLGSRPPAQPHLAAAPSPAPAPVDLVDAAGVALEDRLHGHGTDRTRWRHGLARADNRDACGLSSLRHGHQRLRALRRQDQRAHCQPVLRCGFPGRAEIAESIRASEVTIRRSIRSRRSHTSSMPRSAPTGRGTRSRELRGCLSPHRIGPLPCSFI
jgi:hypothetical protein